MRTPQRWELEIEAFPPGSIGALRDAPDGWIPASAFTIAAVCEALTSSLWEQIDGYFRRRPEGTGRDDASGA